MPEAGKTPGTPRKKTIAAGPKKSAVRVKAEPSELDRLQAVIVGSLEDDKAENVLTLDLAGKAAFCDRMVIATGLADRQIAAMAEHLSQKLHQAGLKRVQVEGAGGADWMLIDAGDIIVHLFKPEARAMYGLERMWGAEFAGRRSASTTRSRCPRGHRDHATSGVTSAAYPGRGDAAGAGRAGAGAGAGARAAAVACRGGAGAW